MASASHLHLANFMLVVLLTTQLPAFAVTALQELDRTLNCSLVVRGWNGGNPHVESWSGVAYGLPPNATHINIACNYLSQNIPHSLSNMKKLRDLNLSNNCLFGLNSNVFAGLDNLEEVDDSYNIVGEIPYGLLPNATHINMACNFLSQNIPHSSLSTVKKLRHLNCLFGLIGNVFIGLDNLKQVNVQQNLFSGILPEHFHTIPNLWIGGNKFYPLGDSPPWAFPLECVLIENNTSRPPTTQANANENFVPYKVRKYKMGRGGIAFMVGGGITLLATLFMALYLNKLRLKIFESNHSSFVFQPVTAAEEVSSTSLNEGGHVRRLYHKTRTAFTRVTMIKYAQGHRYKIQRTIRALRTTPRKAALLIGMMHMDYPPESKMRLVHPFGEVTSLRDILKENYNFEEENITTLCDFGGFTYPTRDDIRAQIDSLLTDAIEGDNLFLYIAGHCFFLTDLTPPAYAIITQDRYALTDDFWSEMMDKVKPGTTLTIIVNTCFAGAFLKSAKVEGHERGRGDIVVFPVCGENEKVKDGKIYYDILEPLLKEAAKKTNLRLYRRFKKDMQDLNLIRREEPPFYCPNSKKRFRFVENARGCEV